MRKQRRKSNSADELLAELWNLQDYMEARGCPVDVSRGTSARAMLDWFDVKAPVPKGHCNSIAAHVALLATVVQMVKEAEPVASRATDIRARARWARETLAACRAARTVRKAFKLPWE